MFQALDTLRSPDAHGDAPEFSLEFVVKNGQRKGQRLRIERATVNHISKQKAVETLQGARPGSKRGKFNHAEKFLIGIRVLESKDVAEPVITVDKYFITRINGLKTFI